MPTFLHGHEFGWISFLDSAPSLTPTVHDTVDPALRFLPRRQPAGRAARGAGDFLVGQYRCNPLRSRNPSAFPRWLVILFMWFCALTLMFWVAYRIFNRGLDHHLC